MDRVIKVYLQVLLLRLGIFQFGFEAVDFTLRFLHLFLELFTFGSTPLPIGLVHPQFGQGPPQFSLFLLIHPLPK